MRRNILLPLRQKATGSSQLFIRKSGIKAEHHYIRVFVVKNNSRIHKISREPFVAEQVHPFAVPVGFEEINRNVRRNYDFVRRNIVTHIVKSCSANLDIV